MFFGFSGFWGFCWVVGGLVFVPQLCCLVGLWLWENVEVSTFWGLLCGENEAGPLSTVGSNLKLTYQREEIVQ